MQNGIPQLVFALSMIQIIACVIHFILNQMNGLKVNTQNCKIVKILKLSITGSSNLINFSLMWSHQEL
uniref:Putative secreted protein n=1 Tax=Xenopsylla cheopis TaxID=163159 RepID=A0A6M2E1Y8_XENCH